MKNDGLAPSGTRYRILEAAGEVFAELGFQRATVRKICQRAGVNLASINYHFGEKEKLYFEVLKYVRELSMGKHPLQSGLSESATPEEKLQNFIHSTLLRIFDEGKPAWFGKLMTKEMIEPTHTFDRFIREGMLPFTNLLESIVRELLGSRFDEDQVRLCCASIIGQCAHYNHSRSVVARILQKEIYTPGRIERIANHITQFSLNGLRHLAEEKKHGKETSWK